jgi:hypothetical protein
MNRAVKIFKIFAAMSDHGPRKGCPSLRRNLDWPGSEEFVMHLHMQKLARR